VTAVSWVLEAVLALIFAAHGSIFIAQPAAADGMIRSLPLSRRLTRCLGVAELLAALGLVLPVMLNTQPWLTPLATLAVVLILAGAIVVHVSRGEVVEPIPWSALPPVP
jgi:uncharacterized membrane protein YphA (DoxX/SURF4 family)